MGEIIKAPRGTADILPPQTSKWAHVEGVMRRLAERFGYGEIRTPIFEHTELFARGVGEGTDIVTKEMYTFTDKGGRSLTLRPELTAPAVRAYLEARLTQQPLVKWYYIGPGFRYERPQSGRFRQFHQFGAEAIGSIHPDLDVEIIALALEVFRNLDLKNLEVKVNSIGCNNCRPEHRAKLREYFAKHRKQSVDPSQPSLCIDCSTHRYETNPLRILDCKVPGCRAFVEGAPTTLQFLCSECALHFEKVQQRLKSIGESVSIDPLLVRGLDYYTKTVFEVVSPSLGAQNSLCGGGRYDNLVESLEGPSKPAVGFAAGIERIVLSMESQNAVFPADRVQIYAVSLGPEAENVLFPLVFKWRAQGIRVERDYHGKSLGSQLKEADRLGASFALIVGENEIKEGKAIIRNLNTREQANLTLDALEQAVIKQVLSGIGIMAESGRRE